MNARNWAVRALACMMGAAPLVIAWPAHAAVSGRSPASASGVVAVSVDLAARAVRFKTCGALPCDADASSASVAIDLARELLPEEKDVLVETTSIGDGKNVVHVRVPAKGPSGSARRVAWEAIFAPGMKAPLFADVTGFARGEEGEHTGMALSLVPRDGAGAFVLQGEIREELRICGQPWTLLAPRALDPKTMTWRGATVQRLSQAERDRATTIVATSKNGPADAPLARILTALGTSAPTGSGVALLDGDASTSWHEERPGEGQGEFVVMRVPDDARIRRIAITARGSEKQAVSGGAAPRTFYLVTDTTTTRVTMPEDAWMHPGTAYEVTFAEPVRTACLALVLDEAYAHDNPKPQVTLSELTAYTEVDEPGATLRTAAEALRGGDARAKTAAVVLARAGDAALAAVSDAYGSLDARGRSLAMDVAMSPASCEMSAPLLARGMGDPDREVSRKGKNKLERCGKSAITALAKVLKEDASLRATIAPLFVTLAREAALPPLAAVMGEGTTETRNVVRAAFATAASTAPPEVLGALLSDASRPREARIDLVRASVARLNEVKAIAAQLVNDLSAADAPFDTRYVLVPANAELAKGGEASAIARISKAIVSDPEWPVRARAAELAGPIDGARSALVRATEDPEPRVRDAALRALTDAHAPDIARIAAERLARDPWTFVHVSAVRALTIAPASSDVDAVLARALTDKSPRVRSAAASALGERRASSQVGALRARAEDVNEEPAVRAAAIRALGAACDQASLPLFTTLAKKTASAPTSDLDAELGAAAIEALGLVHPGDLEARFAPLLAPASPPAVRAAAKRALASRSSCR